MAKARLDVDQHGRVADRANGTHRANRANRANG
jgi:hypothetical protein